MSLILLVLGVLTAAAGVATVGFGIPINEFSLGTTLIVAGTTAFVGGLILIGLSAVVNELGQVAEGMRTRIALAGYVAPSSDIPETASVAAPQPQRSATEAPASRSADLASAKTPASAQASAAGFERLRSTSPPSDRQTPEPSVVADAEEVPLSPNGAPHQPPQQASHPVLREPKLSEDDRASAQAVEALKASRLDFLFRSKPLRAAGQSDNFDAFWPADARSRRNADDQPQTRTVEAGQGVEADASVREPAEVSSPEEALGPAILKSGIVDGMPYTLYADGSIEAKLPQGTVRFGSISELRGHIESNS